MDTELQELLRLHEIVTWQIGIAKDYKVRELRQKQQKELQEKIKQLKSQQNEQH